MNRYKCPECGQGRFHVSPHVLQDWIVDEHGNWLETTNECVEVLHRPEMTTYGHVQNAGMKPVVTK